MALEFLGERYLQPVFGSSIDVWAAVISVFILSLGLGYAVGGWMADRPGCGVVLGWVILGAGACFILLPLYVSPLLRALGPEIHTMRWGPLLASVILFLPPSLLLGSVTPMLIRLTLADVSCVGRVTGTFYALNSLGNVAGVLLSAYALLAWFTLDANMKVMGACLSALGLSHLFRPLSDSST